ncbi:MAG TPA: NAD-dependent epimerase/dehydratase family protein [Pseudomonadales bacterium]|nr:NAD-dependent epimerase/dehydratase family protein [Pseudomonadales bacterium]
MVREKVLLTGASGSMGFAAFEELWRRRDRFDIVLLLRPSAKNVAMFAPCLEGRRVDGPGTAHYHDGSLKIVWGDAVNHEDIRAACAGVDAVLNPMAFIAPAADHDPATAEAVNAVAVQSLVKAIRAEPDGAERIRLLHVGSVAQYGDRLPPRHMIRTGDPMQPSVFDFYATTKIRGERAVIESGIRHWASLRQTFITIPSFLTDLLDPITFHLPINTAIEMNTKYDAGRGLVNALDVPRDSDFWGRVYNMAGGPACRVSALGYMKTLFELTGAGDYRRLFERRWFATRNFHCGWFADSHVLNGYLQFWRDDNAAHYEQVRQYMSKLAADMQAAGTPMPGGEDFIRATLEQMVDARTGTRFWRNNGYEARLRAFFGSAASYDAIPDWDVDMPPMPQDVAPRLLDHGYDESKPRLETYDLRQAAEFRGGRLLSPDWDGNGSTVLEWQDAEGRQFSASPNLVLKAGHWSPHEAAPPWDFDRVARRNPFFAQVWHNTHAPDEDNFYPPDCYLDVV